MTEVFFALLLLLSLRLVQNLPINATSVNDCGNDNLQAKDYNYRKTLTTFSATANCTVAGSVKVVKAAAKVPFRSFDGGDVGLCCDNRSYSSQSIRLKYLDNSAANMEYAQSNRKDVAKTIMFSELIFFNAMTAAVTKGDNTLGLEVWCVQMGCTGCTLVAKWSTRRIPQSPTDIPNWIHTRQITRTASLEPKCDQIPPKPEWVARHFK
ncbi:MAG: hypothetical protein NXY57DRAFT_1040412 [Lentinula lateritia]|nr:MAG: hypothetical protein NXY57DRAFT_1040412 [Lentinula lateritia]